MEQQSRLDKFLSREFVVGVLGALLFSLAYFLKGGVDFSDFAFWLTIALGIPAGALTVQKAVGSLGKGG